MPTTDATPRAAALTGTSSSSGAAPRALILSASMGAGHDGVAAEMSRRLGCLGFEVVRVDFLDLLPMRLGPGLRRFYQGLLDHLPWGYELIYRTFFFGRNSGRDKVSPVVRAALAALRRTVLGVQPDVVLATYHLAGRAVGELVLAGDVVVPAVTVVTDFAVHDLWLHSGTSAYLCVDQHAAKRAAERTGAPALATGPVVRPGFAPASAARRHAKRAELGIAAGARVVLVVAGSWTVGDVAATTGLLAESGRFVPVTVCGHDAALRSRLSRFRGVALGWVDDMAGLMAATDVLVENAGGLTAVEAMAAGVPVVTYRPIPGHGRDNAQRMHRSGVSLLARDPTELFGHLDRLFDHKASRDRLTAAGAELFKGDPASVVASLVPGAGEGPGSSGTQQNSSEMAYRGGHTTVAVGAGSQSGDESGWRQAPDVV